MSPASHIAKEWMELAPQAPLVGIQAVQSLPKGYFDHLADAVLDRIRSAADWEAEIQGISPVLAQLPRQSPQQLPAQYFEGSAQRILPQIPAKKLVPDSPAKVFSLRRSLQWAVAACLAGVLVAGAYFLNNAPSSGLPSPAAMGVVEDQDLTQLGEQEMDQYLQTQAQLSLLSAESTEDLNLDPASKIEQLTEDELLQYLQQEETTAAAQQTS